MPSSSASASSNVRRGGVAGFFPESAATLPALASDFFAAAATFSGLASPDLSSLAQSAGISGPATMQSSQKTPQTMYLIGSALPQTETVSSSFLMKAQAISSGKPSSDASATMFAAASFGTATAITAVSKMKIPHPMPKFFMFRPRIEK